MLGRERRTRACEGEAGDGVMAFPGIVENKEGVWIFCKLL